MSGGCGIYCMWRNKYKSNLGASLYFMLDRSRNGLLANQSLEAQPQMSRFLLTLVTHALEKGAREGWGRRGFLEEKLKEVNPCKPHTGHLDPRQISGTTLPSNTLLAVLFCSRATMFSFSSSQRQCHCYSGMGLVFC